MVHLPSWSLDAGVPYTARSEKFRPSMLFALTVARRVRYF